MTDSDLEVQAKMIWNLWEFDQDPTDATNHLKALIARELKPYLEVVEALKKEKELYYQRAINAEHALRSERTVREQFARDAMELAKKVERLEKDIETGFMKGAYARLKELQAAEARLASAENVFRLIKREAYNEKSWAKVVDLIGQFDSHDASTEKTP